MVPDEGQPAAAVDCRLSGGRSGPWPVSARAYLRRCRHPVRRRAADRTRPRRGNAEIPLRQATPERLPDRNRRRGLGVGGLDTVGLSWTSWDMIERCVALTRDSVELRTRGGRNAVFTRGERGIRRSAAIPIGRDRLTVKPSAQPTLVRTQHLPPANHQLRDATVSLILFTGLQSDAIRCSREPLVVGYTWDGCGLV